MITCQSNSGLIQEFPDATSLETLPEYAQILVKRGKLKIIGNKSTVAEEEEILNPEEEYIPNPPDEGASKSEWERYITENFEPVPPNIGSMTRAEMIAWVKRQS